MTNVIFDTNSARKLAEKTDIESVEVRAKEWAQKFKTHSYNILLSPIVLQELMCHLTDREDHDFMISYKTIKVLILLSEKLGDGVGYGIMNPAELLIAHEIVGMKIESREKMYDSILNFCHYLAHRSLEEMPDIHTQDGSTMLQYSDDIRNEFCNQVRTMIIDEFGLTPQNVDKLLDIDLIEESILLYITRTTYNLLAAEGKIVNIFDKLKELGPFNGHELIMQLRKDQQEIKRRYPAHLLHFKKVIKKTVQGMSDRRLRNCIWDILLMFHINDHTINKEPFIFVTDDGDMYDTASELGLQQRVLHFQEFAELII